MSDRRPGLAMKPCRTKLGQFIRQHRLQRGLTQQKVNELAKLGKMAITYLELGNRNRFWLNPDQQQRLCQVIGCDPAQLRALATKQPKRPETPLGKMIRTKRLRLGWTTKEAAARIGTNASTLSQLERGDATLTRSMATKVSAGLAIPRQAFRPFIRVKQYYHGGPEKASSSVLGNTIRTRRKELGWTQQKLGHQLRISRQAVSMIELGHVPLSNGGSKTLGRLARVLEMDFKTLRCLAPIKRRRKRHANRVKPRSTRIGRVLTSWRRAEDLSQLVAAQRLGISLAHYWAIESGHEKPGRETIAMIEKILGESATTR